MPFNSRIIGKTVKSTIGSPSTTGNVINSNSSVWGIKEAYNAMRGGKWSNFGYKYMRVSARQSTSNTGTHFVEIQAYDTKGVNAALGKVPTVITGTGMTGTLSNLTNGATDTNTYVGFDSTSLEANLQIDFQDVYDISYFKVWMYYADGRYYYNFKIEMSLDGINFVTVFGPNNFSANGVAIPYNYSYDFINNSVAGLSYNWYSGDYRSTIATGNIGSYPIGSAVTTSISYGSRGDYYGFIAIGYFRPPSTGTYSFWTSSDDGSGVWIGNTALPSYPRSAANATLNNGLGVGQGDTKRGASISLTGGVWYPIRIVHEEGGGGDNLTFSWAGPGIGETTSLTSYFRTEAVGGVATGKFVNVGF